MSRSKRRDVYRTFDLPAPPTLSICGWNIDVSAAKQYLGSWINNSNDCLKFSKLHLRMPPHEECARCVMARYYRGKRIAADFYTRGKFGKRIRETLDTDNEFLYADGRYPTKLTKCDLPDDYIEFRSRAIWYMKGYLRTSGIVDMQYSWAKENHLFKDDYIYISYTGPIEQFTNQYGIKDFTAYDLCVCGGDIIDIVLAAEKNSGFDTASVRQEIEKKRIWLRDNEPEYYAQYIGEDRDLFELWNEKVQACGALKAKNQSD